MDVRVFLPCSLILSIALLLCQIIFVSSEAEFSIRIKFDTRVERDISGFCCSGVSHTNNDSCSSECSLRMRVCLKEYQSHIEPNSICTYGVRETSSIEQPLTFPFSFAWPGYFTIIVEAWNSPNSDLPHSDLTDKLVLRMSEAKSVEVGNNWVSERHSSGDLWFSVEYRVTCALNYYGKSCMQFCKPRDNQWGHFQCSSQGRKSCLQGWKGPNCDKPVCLPGCNTKHGSCSVPNECMCLEGWTGDKCDLCQRYPGCMEGSCESPWQCLCNEGWGGIFCNQDLNYCTHHQPCENQATCTNSGQGHYTCTCMPGFAGTNCERRLLDAIVLPSKCHINPCKNDGRCIESRSGFKCICAVGFEGDECEINRDDCTKSACLNGGTCVDGVNAFQCHCSPGFTGILCHNSQSHCLRNPCANGAKCIDLHNDFRCDCAPNFRGRDCSLLVSPILFEQRFPTEIVSKTSDVVVGEVSNSSQNKPQIDRLIITGLCLLLFMIIVVIVTILILIWRADKQINKPTPMFNCESKTKLNNLYANSNLQPNSPIAVISPYSFYANSELQTCEFDVKPGFKCKLQPQQNVYDCYKSRNFDVCCENEDFNKESSMHAIVHETAKFMNKNILNVEDRCS